jgi:hypothetical protein
MFKLQPRKQERKINRVQEIRIMTEGKRGMSRQAVALFGEERWKSFMGCCVTSMLRIKWRLQYDDCIYDA